MADKLQFGIGYGFIVTASTDGTIPLNAKALAKVEPGGDEAAHEMVRRANQYPGLLAALQMVCDSGIPLADEIERAMLNAIKGKRT